VAGGTEAPKLAGGTEVISHFRLAKASDRCVAAMSLRVICVVSVMALQVRFWPITGPTALGRNAISVARRRMPLRLALRARSEPGGAPKNWCDRLQLSLQAILQVTRSGS
jgi:hypothetical protein